MRNVFIVILLFFIVYSNSFSQKKDTLSTSKQDSVYYIVFKDWSAVHAVSIDSTSQLRFLINNLDGSRATVDKNLVVSISKIKNDFEPQPKPKKQASKKSKSPKPNPISDKTRDSISTLPLRPLIEAGFTIGTPAGFNFFAGFASQYFYSHISGMDLGIIKGIQLEFGYPFSNNRNSYLGTALAFGYSELKENNNSFEGTTKGFKYTYAGALFNFAYKVLYGHVGLGYGNGMPSNLQLLFQIGLRARIGV